jgi:hypothetical protein
MIVSTHQPYFSPFSGFFYKAYLADVFVVLDTVQFPRGTTWISRNRFKNDQGTLWLTIPVWKKGLGLQRIHEVRVCHEFRWAAKHLASLKSAYAKAPYFADHMPFLEEAYLARFEKLIDLNLTIIRYLFRQLKIDTEIKLLSEANAWAPQSIWLSMLPGNILMGHYSSKKTSSLNSLNHVPASIRSYGAALSPTCRLLIYSSIAAPRRMKF